MSGHLPPGDLEPLYGKICLPAHEPVGRHAPLFANASKCELDSQGRIVIPQKLRRYAGLDKDVVILGVNDRAEIWSADAWQAQEEEEMTPEKMSACMEALGF